MALRLIGGYHLNTKIKIKWLNVRKNLIPETKKNNNIILYIIVIIMIIIIYKYYIKNINIINIKMNFSSFSLIKIKYILRFLNL